MNAIVWTGIGVAAYVVVGNGVMAFKGGYKKANWIGSSVRDTLEVVYLYSVLWPFALFGTVEEDK